MPGEPGEQLAKRRNHVLVLSLVVDQQHRLIQGELVDLHTNTRKRFYGWRGLLKTLRAWLLGTDPDGQHPNP